MQSINLTSNKMVIIRCVALAALLIPCIFIEACFCECREKKNKPAGGENELSVSGPISGVEKLSGALSCYLKELKVIETNSKFQALKQISHDQKSTVMAFNRRLNDKNSLFDDPTGKFKELEPLVRANKIDEIIAALKRISHENRNDPLVTMEADRKLAICYYITGDHLKCSGHMARYHALLEENTRREDAINETILKNFKNDIDY